MSARLPRCRAVTLGGVVSPRATRVSGVIMAPSPPLPRRAGWWRGARHLPAGHLDQQAHDLMALRRRKALPWRERGAGGEPDGRVGLAAVVGPLLCRHCVLHPAAPLPATRAPP